MEVARDLDRLGCTLPVDERAALSKLSPPQVPAWADARAAEYERRIKDIMGHISTFRSLRNTQSPMHVLPSKLLGRIFAEGCSTRDAVRVVQVCRRWRAVAMGTPRFWANALKGRETYCSHASERDFLRVALSHSGALPILGLTVVFEVVKAWPIIRPHASRLVSLVAHVDLAGQVTALEAVLRSGELHNLRSVRAMTRLRFPPRLSLDARSLPCLRKLHIDGVLLTCTSTVDSLEDLRISESIREPWHDLACALKPCTALKALHLYNALPQEWPDKPGDFGFEAVALQKLCTFVLEDGPNYIRKLLHHLALPLSVTSIHIIMVLTADGQTLLDALPPNYMQRFHENPLFDRLYLNHPSDRSGSTSARFYAGAQEHLQTTAFIDDGNTLRGFLEPTFMACEHSPLSTLAIDIRPVGYYLPDHEMWGCLLERLPHLRRLELVGRAFYPLAEYLATMFLNTCGDQDPTNQSSGLTLAWVLELGIDDSEEEEGERVASELLDLALIMEGARRCSRLEVYAAKYSDTYLPSLGELPTRPDVLKTLAAPALSRLSGLVDVLAIL